MITMIVEDVAVVVVILLFVWLVPMRRNGIPGLRGRGRAPVSPMAAGSAREPRPIPRAEQADEAEREDRVVARLGQARGASYAGLRPGQDRGHKNSA